MAALVVGDRAHLVGEERAEDVEAPEVAVVPMDQDDRHTATAVVAHRESDATGVDEQVLSHASKVSRFRFVVHRRRPALRWPRLVEE